jgi:DHA1 family multidrug resistance protein-like MFS transporter
MTFALGVGMPETYGREILRRRSKARGLAPPNLPLAESGVTIAQMTTITVINPLKQLALEPIVAMISFTLALNWAVTFQWFITVPIVLQTVYKFTPQQAGLAMISAIGGTSLAALFTIGIEQAIAKSCKTPMAIEKRLIPAMYGSVLIAGSLFWIGWTADPKFHYLSPIFGTAVFIWGGVSVLVSTFLNHRRRLSANTSLQISLITYLFDAYPAAGTLAALTAAACIRIAAAGIVPLVIVQGKPTYKQTHELKPNTCIAFIALGGNWALSIFGFISIPLIAVPFVLYKWGPALRMRSPYSQSSSIHSHMPLPKETERMRSRSYESFRIQNV